MPKFDKLTGKSVNEGIDRSGGAVGFTGSGIDFYRLLTLRQALKLHKQGVRVLPKHMGAPTTIARKQFGLKGNLDSLIAQVDEILERIQEERRADVQAQHDELYEAAIEERIKQGGDCDA